MTVTCLCRSKLDLDASGFGFGSGFSRIFSMMKVWTFLTDSAAPIIRQTLSVVPVNYSIKIAQNETGLMVGGGYNIWAST